MEREERRQREREREREGGGVATMKRPCAETVRVSDPPPLSLGWRTFLAASTLAPLSSSSRATSRWPFCAAR